MKKPLKQQQKRALKSLLKSNSTRLLVIGLGNPGRKYTETRHNAGFMVLELLARRFDISFRKRFLRPVETAELDFMGHSLILVKPLTYMNNSGEIIPWLLRTYKTDPAHMLIISDHLDIPAGSLRLKRKGSSGGQRGLESVIRYIGTTDFPRLYVGVGRPGEGRTVVDHVLGTPSGEEAEYFKASVERASSAVLKLCTDPIDKVMNDVNRRPSV